MKVYQKKKDEKKIKKIKKRRKERNNANKFSIALFSQKLLFCLIQIDYTLENLKS